MQRTGARLMGVVAMSMVLRHASGFVAPMRSAIRQAAGTNVRCWMSASAPPARVPILDAEGAELKAERLWGMADAQKPRTFESGDMGLPDEVENRLRDSQKLSTTDGMVERDDFVEEEGEASALRRYQYNELTDFDNGDDEREYYI